MHLHFERNSNARCDCAILSLTWMGKVPDELPEEEGWKLNRTNYYQEGWLATGNVRGIVGVTFTTSHCRKNPDFPLRTNYNLRGHSSEVILVKWNEPYQKLASCDSSGIIFVWIKYEGRWSIELINDRNTPVTHFAWSHDGRMALICYQDGFVLVGSVAGQRYWSSMLSLESTITCGIWTPDDQQVYFGTTSGRLIVMDVHGAMVSQVQLTPDHGSITAMAWSCEKFKMEEGDEGAAAATASCEHHSPTGGEERNFVLAVSLKSGVILLMKNFDDVSPVSLHTGLLGICMEWSNSRELLAVAGTRACVDGSNLMEPPSATSYINNLLFYSDTGTLVYSAVIPFTQSPVTALTWGHNDKRLFVATGCHVHIAWVSRRIASLQLLSGLSTHEQLRGELQVAALPLPPRIRALVTNLFAQTIRVSECFMPEVQHIREFVSRPPVGSVRLHCTMIRHDEESSAGTCYTLYLEYLGGLVPLLKGKRTSKIRPEFVIFDPQHEVHDYGLNQGAPSAAVPADASLPEVTPCSDSSDSEQDEGCASPRVQRRKRRRRRSQGSPGAEDLEDLTYVDTLPEHVRLVQVTSNIWGTKFKIHGLATSLPANLGHVTYKTSLLHLQPRQMTLVMTELRDDVQPGPDPSFNPNLFSEDEEEVTTEHDRLLPSHTDIAPIAPMTPRPQSTRSRFQARPTRTPVNREPVNCEESNFRTTGSGIGAPRHTLPPLCGGDTQSTKHTVAPRDSMDVLTDTQGADYSSSVHRIKSLMMSEATSASSSVKEGVTTSSLRTKRREKTAAVTTCHKPQRRDEEFQTLQQQQGSSKRSPLVSNSLPMDPMVRSCSVGYLDLVDLALNSHGPLGDLNQNETPPKRLVLVHKKKEQPKPKLKHCGKSKSLDSSDIFPKEVVSKSSLLLAAASELVPSGTTAKFPSNTSNVTHGASSGIATVGTMSMSHPIQTRREVDGTGRIMLINATDGMPNSRSPTPRLPHSTPTSPAMAKKNRNRTNSPIRSIFLITLGWILFTWSPLILPGSLVRVSLVELVARRQLFNSPLLSRRARKGRSATESSDDEVTVTGTDARNFWDLETFQKAQLRQKLRRGKGTNADSATSRRRELVMHNKAPMWNEHSQVYQLDFGGRVTQESAKNFQIEFRGKQVMQFGRIDGNAYTLDFQYPFSALQAFAVALANVTQRLK